HVLVALLEVAFCSSCSRIPVVDRQIEGIHFFFVFFLAPVVRLVIRHTQNVALHLQQVLAPHFHPVGGRIKVLADKDVLRDRYRGRSHLLPFPSRRRRIARNRQLVPRRQPPRIGHQVGVGNRPPLFRVAVFGEG